MAEEPIKVNWKYNVFSLSKIENVELLTNPVSICLYSNSPDSNVTPPVDNGIMPSSNHSSAWWFISAMGLLDESKNVITKRYSDLPSSRWNLPPAPDNSVLDMLNGITRFS